MIRLGDLTLHTIETGTFGLDGGAMFGIVPKPLWERRITPDARNRIPLHMRCLLVEYGERLILIDAGLGHKYDAKFATLFAVDHTRHTLEGGLRSAGYAPEDVTDVLLTHLHFDHAGGCTRREGGKLALTFPRAMHHVQAAHWHAARAPNARERASFLSENLDPLAASGQLHLLDGPAELWPGIAVEVVHGHTEAQQIVILEGGGRGLVYVADLLPTSHHLAPAWTMAYDLRPLESMAEKAALLDRAHAAGWSVFFEHDPDVVVSNLEQTERGYAVADPRTLEDL